MAPFTLRRSKKKEPEHVQEDVPPTISQVYSDAEDELNSRASPDAAPGESSQKAEDVELPRRKAEDVAAALGTVNTRMGAQRDMAMATYTTHSYEDYEQTAVVDEPDPEGPDSVKPDNSSEFSFARDESVSPLRMDGTVPLPTGTVSEKASEPEVLQPLPRRPSNLDRMSRASDIAKPRIVSVDHHPGDETYVCYPAPIPSTIKLPPLLSKRTQSFKPEGSGPAARPAGSGAHFPMTAPMETEPAEDDDSASDDSSVPATPGFGPDFPNPHEALDAVLDNWERQESAMEPFTPGAELPAIDGPKSLIHELEERKLHQKSRQKNAASNRITLLQMDDVIKRGQQNRRAVVDSNGLGLAAEVKVGEDEVPLGVIYNRKHDDAYQASRREPVTLTENIQRYSMTSARVLEKEQMMAHMRRSSGASVLPRARTFDAPVLPRARTFDAPVLPRAHTLDDPALPRAHTFDSPPLTHGRKQSFASSNGGAPIGAIMPEEPRTLSRLRQRDSSMPNLHDAMAGGALNVRAETPASHFYGAPDRDLQRRTYAEPHYAPAPQYGYVSPPMQQGQLGPPSPQAYAPSPQAYAPPSPQQAYGQPGPGQYAYQPGPPPVQYAYPPGPPPQPRYTPAVGDGYLREPAYAVPTPKPGSHIRAPQLNSEEALVKRLRDRESVMMGYPVQQPGPPPVSMMTREGHDLVMLRQQMSNRQSYMRPSPARGAVHTSASTIAPIDPGNVKRMEVVERWRRSVYTG